MSLINLFMDFGAKRVKHVKIETFHRLGPQENKTLRHRLQWRTFKSFPRTVPQTDA